MGNQFSVKNSKHEVSCDLQDGKSVISFKVKDRRNFANPQHFIHYKRYKHCQLPSKIKAKFKNVSQLHKFLSQNASIITIGEKDVIIQLDGDKINVPFENISHESKIFCETQNMEIDFKKAQMQNTLVKIIRNDSPRNTKSHVSQRNDDESKAKIKKIIKKMIKKSNPLRQTDIKEQSLEELVQRLEQEWQCFDKNKPGTPDMRKKKTREIAKGDQSQSSEIQQLKGQIGVKSRQLQILRNKFEGYKQEWNLQKFMQQIKKNESLVKKEALAQVLQQISEYSERLRGKTEIKIQLKSRSALVSWIDNLTRELQEYRSKEKCGEVRKLNIPKQQQYMNSSHISKGFSGIYEGQNLSKIEKEQIEKRVELDV